MKTALLLFSTLTSISAFTPAPVTMTRTRSLFMAEDTKEAKLVSGEELEVMLTEWDAPLVLDAYATW
jgi:hypothetical protein